MSDDARRRVVFTFEDLGSDLSRPPLAALRFLRRNGLSVPARTWKELPADVRWAIATEGARDDFDAAANAALVQAIPIRGIRLTDKNTHEDAPALGLLVLLGPEPGLPEADWAKLPAFHRFVLNSLASNQRLLWYAWREMQGLGGAPAQPWRGLVAHAEVEVLATGSSRAELVQMLAEEKVLGGRGFVLARTAGRRAARAAHKVFDLYSETAAGVVELDWVVKASSGTVLWQAHVSTHSGAFFPLASLAAAANSAICLADMIRDIDPLVRVKEAKIAEEEWQVGRMEGDEATIGWDQQPAL